MIWARWDSKRKRLIASVVVAHKFRSLWIQIRNYKRQSFSLPLSQNFNFFLKTLLHHLFHFISIENTAAMHDMLTNFSHAFGRAWWGKIHTERIPTIFTEEPKHHRHHYDLKENRGVHRKLCKEFQVRDAQNQWVKQKRFQAGRGREFGFWKVWYLTLRNANCWKICYNLQVPNSPLNIHIIKIDPECLPETLQHFGTTHLEMITSNLDEKDIHVPVKIYPSSLLPHILYTFVFTSLCIKPYYLSTTLQYSEIWNTMMINYFANN